MRELIGRWWHDLVFRSPKPPDQDVEPHSYVPGEEIPSWLFVSHTTVDERATRKLVVSAAQDNKFNLHLINRSSAPFISDGYKKKILRSLAWSGKFAAIVSKDAAQSQWVRFEVEWAAAHRVCSNAFAICLDDTAPAAIHPWLAGVERVDGANAANSLEAEQHVRRIMQRWLTVT